MPDLTPEQHGRRFQDLERQASNFRNAWQELSDYLTPWRDPITASHAAGQKQTNAIFDSTATTALIVASAAVHSLTTPSSARWFNLTHIDPSMRLVTEVGQASEKATEAVRSSLNNSNFAQESQEVITDLLAFGTGALFWEVKPPTARQPWPGLRFRALPPGSYVCAENPDGVVDTLYRKFNMSAEAIIRRWPDAANKKKLADAMKDGRPDAQFSILHAIFPRMADEVSEENSMAVPPKRRPWGSIYFLAAERGDMQQTGHAAGLTQGLDKKNLEILSENGYFEFPVMVPRWYKQSGETYGRSPGMNALPDIRTLNKAVELRMKAWQLAIAPPFATSERGVIGDVRFSPLGRTYTMGDPRTAIQTIDIGSNFQVNNFEEDKLRRAIQASFFIDQISSVQSQGLTPKTATEVSVNFEMMMRILGPVSTRLQNEFLVPLVTGVFRALQRHEAIDIEVESNGLLSGDDLFQIIFEGPLARSTSIQEVDAINRWLQVALPLAEFQPDVLSRVDFEALGRVTADAVGVPRSILKTDDQVEAEKEAQAQQQAMANSMGVMQQGAEILNKVGPAVQQQAPGGGPGGLPTG